MTLIEILVVVGLAALITGVFIPSIVGAFREKGESTARKIALIVGQARDRAMLTNKLVRLQLDLDKQKLNFEEAPSAYLVPKPQDRPPSEREKEEQEKKEAGTFAQSLDLMKEPMELPKGLRIIEVRSPRFKAPLKEGVGYLYFFNNGSADGGTIFLETEDKVHVTIVVHPITGQSRIENYGPDDKR